MSTDLVHAHGNLVQGSILRYQTGDQTPEAVPGILARADKTAAVCRDLVATIDKADRTGGVLWCLSLGCLSATCVSMGITVAVPSFFFFGLIPVVAAFLLLTGVVGFGFVSMRADARLRALEATRTATVPASVADAYRRITSAADEIENGDHDPEVIASARLATEGARDLLALIHGHHTAGTLHTGPAQALVGEAHRLAADIDAYLVLSRNQAIALAPGEDDAISVLSRTTQLSFPTQDPTS